MSEALPGHFQGIPGHQKRHAKTSTKNKKNEKNLAHNWLRARKRMPEMIEPRKIKMLKMIKSCIVSIG